ncbi:acyltransferase [Geodermatophilus sp. SYSU D00710]
MAPRGIMTTGAALAQAITRDWPGLGRDIVLNRLLASPLVPVPLRWRLLRAYGLEIAKSRISPDVWIGSSRLSVGEGTFINTGCFFNTSAPITIGARCNIAMQVLFTTSSHEPGDRSRRAGLNTAQPIVVGDGTWIGARATILPGVTIGEGCVIAAGAVVTEDCEPHALYGGVPARLIHDA